MKLKLVVASMGVLGLISFPALAETTTTTTTDTTQSTNATQQTNATQTAAPIKKKHIHHHHHHMASVSHEVAAANVVATPAPAPVVEAMPKVDPTAITWDALTQNTGRGHPGPEWFNHILINGGINVDAAWGNRSFGYMGENTRRVSVNDAYLNATALVNDWVKGFMSLSYNDAYPANTPSAALANVKKFGNYSNAYTNNRLNVEQGYITIGNFDCSPFFAQLGKQFQPFGRYQIHPIERTMAQVMTESLQTSAEVGFLTRIGVSGAIYAFDNPLVQTTLGHTKTVFGGNLGFDMPSDQLGFDLGVGYMSSLTGVNDVAAAITAFETSAPGANPIGSYANNVGAWNAYGDLNTGPFTIGARYVSAIQNFRPTTLSTTYLATAAGGAKPWAADITAGYGFNAWCKNQNIYLGYQASNNAVNLALPRSRWIAGYGIEVLKNTDLGLQYGHDKDYSSGNGGTGQSSNTVNARVAVQFG